MHMTIIVTGGAGFIGSNFILHILQKYHEYRIICLDKLTYAGNLSTLESVMNNPNFRFVKADICDRETVYSPEQRLKAIELYIKYGFYAAAVIRELGYPSETRTLKSWYLQYNQDGFLKTSKESYGKYTDEEKHRAIEVYLEPGEAIALNAGYLLTEVMDIVHNGMDILILDASAACHMPDVLEMPYRPPLRDGYEAGEKPYTYRLSSMTCLAGDVIGDYSFEHKIEVGNRLVFEDMAIYSMVKNNTFNGMPLPAIALLEENGDAKIVKEFGYEDFKERLS